MEMLKFKKNTLVRRSLKMEMREDVQRKKVLK